MAEQSPPILKPKVIVVGGGLAGLMTTIKVAEAGIPVGPVLVRAGQAQPFRLRAGRHQRGGQYQRRGRLAVRASRRHRVRRRLPRQPAAGQAHVRQCPRHHLSAGPHGRHVQSHRAKGCSISGASAAPSTTGRRIAGATTGQQLLYALDEQTRRHEVSGRCEQARVLGILGHRAGRRRRLQRASSPRTCAPCRSKSSKPTPSCSRRAGRASFTTARPTAS